MPFARYFSLSSSAGSPMGRKKNECDAVSSWSIPSAAAFHCILNPGLHNQCTPTFKTQFGVAYFDTNALATKRIALPSLALAAISASPHRAQPNPILDFILCSISKINASLAG